MRYRASILVAAAALVGALSPAGAGSVTVDIGPIASLQAGGQSVVVPVRVGCPARAPSDGIQENRLEVRQERRGTLVVGVGGTGNLACDGKMHTYLITAHVQEPTHRFGPGQAVANMFVLICNGTGSLCMQGDVTEGLLIAGRAGG